MPGTASFVDDSDFRPAGDPRDPRADLHRSAQSTNRHRHVDRLFLPKVPLAIGAGLLVVVLVSQWTLVTDQPRAFVSALVFGLVVVVPLSVVLLWADRRWPQRRADETTADGDGDDR